MANDLTIIAGEINQEHDACEAAFSESLTHARRAGELLIEAKGQVEHGEWLGWVEANCKFAPRTAQVYMRIERNWEELANTQGLALLGVEGAAKLLAAPSEVQVNEHGTIIGSELERLEGEMEDDLELAWNVGRSLQKVRDERLYLLTHRSWSDYCLNRWGMTTREVNAKIDGSYIRDFLEERASPKERMDRLKEKAKSLESITDLKELVEMVREANQLHFHYKAEAAGKWAEFWKSPYAHEIMAMSDSERRKLASQR